MRSMASLLASSAFALSASTFFQSLSLSLFSSATFSFSDISSNSWSSSAMSFDVPLLHSSALFWYFVCTHLLCSDLLFVSKPSLARTSLVRVLTQTTREYNPVRRTFYAVNHMSGLDWISKTLTRTSKSRFCFCKLGNLSTWRFWATDGMRTSKLVSSYTCLHTAAFILLGVFSLEETISLKMSVRLLSWYEKCLLPLSVGGSKTSLA